MIMTLTASLCYLSMTACQEVSMSIAGCQCAGPASQRRTSLVLPGPPNSRQSLTSIFFLSEAVSITYFIRRSVCYRSRTFYLYSCCPKCRFFNLKDLFFYIWATEINIFKTKTICLYFKLLFGITYILKIL